MTPKEETDLRDLLVKRGQEVERAYSQIGKLHKLVLELTRKLEAYEKAANDAPAEPAPTTPEPAASTQASAAQAERDARKKKKRKEAKKARKASRLSMATADLERQEERYTPDQCPNCQGTELVFLSEDIHEVVTLIPAKLMVRVVCREHCRCAKCDLIVVADAPADLLPKVNASPSVLAKNIYDKQGLYLTTYRIRQEWDRMGLRIHAGTLDGWMAAPAKHLDLLLPALKADIFAEGLMHFDGTGHKVLKKGGTFLGQMAVYGNDVGVYYDFSQDKKQDHIEAFLGYGTKDVYRGLIVSDADPRLDRFFKDHPNTECGCNAHALRYFERAESNDPRKANDALSFWGEMYLWEQRAEEQGLTGEALLAWRQKHQAPIAAKLHDFLHSLRGRYLPKEPIHIAVMYALRQWNALTRFLTDARIPMDNNFAERCLRKVVVGRKNCLFMGSVAAGKRAATYFSFIETCRVHEVDPVAWMTDVLPRIPVTRPSELHRLLPGAWKAAQKEAAQKEAAQKEAAPRERIQMAA